MEGLVFQPEESSHEIWLDTAPNYVDSLWDTLIIPESLKKDRLADSLLEQYSLGLDYRMERQNLFTSNGREIYGLIYQFLSLANNIVNIGPSDLDQLAEFNAAKKDRLNVMKKINEAFVVLHKLEVWSSKLASVFIGMYHRLIMDPDYAGFTGKDLDNDEFMEDVFHKFIKPAINRRNVLLNHITRETPRLLKLVREVFDGLMKLDYLFGSRKRGVEAKFQAVLDKTEKFMQETIKEIKRVQDVAQERRIVVAEMLYIKLAKQFLMQIQSGMGPMRRFALEIDENGNVVWVENQNDWFMQLGHIMNTQLIGYITESLWTLWDVTDPYLLPLTRVKSLLNLPDFRIRPELFLELMIMSYVANQHTFPVDLKLYTSTRMRPIPDVHVRKELYDFVLKSEITYKTDVDIIMNFIQEPKTSNFDKLILILLTEHGVIADQQNQLDDWYNQHRNRIDPLINREAVVKSVSTLLINIIVGMEDPRYDIMRLYFSNSILNLPQMGRAVKRGKGSVINDLMPPFLQFSPDLVPEPVDVDISECCLFEVDIPAGTRGVFYISDAGFFVSPCSEFIVKDYKGNKGRLVYKGSKLRVINREQFVEMMKDYNEHRNKKLEIIEELNNRERTLRAEIIDRLLQEGTPQGLIDILAGERQVTSENQASTMIQSLLAGLTTEQVEAIRPILMTYINQGMELKHELGARITGISQPLAFKYNEMMKDFIERCRGRGGVGIGQVGGKRR